jgi:hypothetical protein
LATRAPASLLDLATWYLTTNLPAPSCEQEPQSDLPAADLAKVVRLYDLRMWVEQGYKQVKHRLGWSDYQVRSDLAIGRHWQLVFCAFTFRSWAYGRLPTAEPAATHSSDPTAGSAGRGKRRHPVSWPQALRAIRGWLEPCIRLVRYWRASSGMPPPPQLRVLPEIKCSREKQTIGRVRRLARTRVFLMPFQKSHSPKQHQT